MFAVNGNGMAFDSMANSTFDVLIVGGGPAGLSAALGLARQFYSVVVFDSEDFRKEPHARMHNFLTWGKPSPAIISIRRFGATITVADEFKIIDHLSNSGKQQRRKFWPATAPCSLRTRLLRVLRKMPMDSSLWTSTKTNTMARK